MTLSFPRRSAAAVQGAIPALCLLAALTLPACGGGSGAAATPPTPTPTPPAEEGLSLLRAQGAQWVNASGTPVALKGTNLGNWLVQEFWMMEQGASGVVDQCTLEAKLSERFGAAEKERLIALYRDNWMKERDWDLLQAFGFNLVRLPILWSVIEDASKPKTLRADAWKYLDWTIAEAKKRGMYVILDLHGAVGGQTPNDHTGCSGQNKYWSSSEYQDRTRWLWEQIATRYKDEPAVAAYDPLNEPWGSTPEEMATRVLDLYQTIRKVDSRHIVLLPSHYGSIEAYGDPAAKGLSNVAFELHPYPGLFGDRPDDTAYEIHRDWLRCGPQGQGGICDWSQKTAALKTPLLMGEFQPWQGAGLELGGKLGRATYDSYAAKGFASTSWAYKVVSAQGGHGRGTWGLVTNAVDSGRDSGLGLLAKASSWDCAGWNSSFAQACARNPVTIKVGGSGAKIFYLVVKTGATGNGRPDVSYDKLSLVNEATQAEVLSNGDFGSNQAWRVLNISGSLSLDFNARGAAQLPSGGEGAALRVTRPAGVSGDINGAVYQAVTLQGGQSYRFSGVFKDNGSVESWAEVYLLDQAPVNGQDVVEPSNKLDFNIASLAEIEALFKRFGSQALEPHPGLQQELKGAGSTLFSLPARPSGLKLSQSSAGVNLSWAANTEADLSGYKVYRSSQPGASGKQLQLLAQGLKTPSYLDSTAQPGQRYFYRVSATDAEDESYRSDELSTRSEAVALPARIEAEDYSAMSGIQLEDCSDVGGGKNVGHFEPDRFIEFKVSVASAGSFIVDYRLASANGSSGFELWLNESKLDSLAAPATGGWQSWKTFSSSTLRLPAGTHTLRLKSVGKEWNINYFEVKAAN